MTEELNAAADPAAAMREAVAHHVAGRLAEAEAGYRAVLELRPSHAEALSMLALILTDGPDLAQAEAIVQRLLAVRPDDGASLLCLARLRVRQGDDVAAVALFERVVARQPNLPPVYNELGVSLNRLERRDEALAALDKAIALNAEYQVARGNRAMVLFDANRFEETVEAVLATLASGDPALADMRVSLIRTLVKAAAKTGRLADAEKAVRASLAAGHDDTETLEQLARLLDHAKRPLEALAVRNDLSRRAGVQRKGPDRAARDTVLVLGAVGAGHVPTRYLLDPDVFSTLFVGLLSPDQPDAPLGAIDVSSFAPAGVVFSTLGDVHRDWGQLAQVETFCERLGKPVVNPATSIRKTGRDSAVALFGDIPGLIVPSARPISPKALATLALDAPVLVRPPGDHGGENLVRLETLAERDAYLAGDPDEELLVTPFYDFRSADGAWRKYRLIFVDREVFPFHLAIGESWLMHYWRAEMARSDWKKAEEERFLDDWRGVFGERGAAAIEEVARRLDLDYGGVDCALMLDGQVLLFEANATILLHLDESAAEFPAKHRRVPPIRDAFTRLVRARADRSRA